MFPLSCLSVLKMQKYQRCNIIAYFLFAPLARERCVDYFPKFNRLRKTAGWQLVVVVLRVCWLRIELAFIFFATNHVCITHRRPNAIRVARMIVHKFGFICVRLLSIHPFNVWHICIFAICNMRTFI